MENRIVFFGTMCLLDNTSGAAISVRRFLEAVAGSGVPCDAFTASLFDPAREVNLRQILGPRADDPSALGKRFIVQRQGVTHSVFRSRSTRSREFSLEEQQAFEKAWVGWLRSNRPKVVVTYGGSPYTLKMQDHARREGCQVVYYLGNAEYESGGFCKSGDIVLTPSNFLRDHYRETLGLEARVLRTIMAESRLDFETIGDPEELEFRRKKGFVTFMTPIPHKGLTIFDGIARLAQQRKPDLKFLVTEGRSNRDWLARRGYPLDQRPNIWFMTNHEDVRSIYQRTSILLMPSLWQEGFGRNILEAQLSGIPVLANDRGGIAEALNGGGFLFDAPAECLEEHMRRPEHSVVEQWWQQLELLLNNAEAYGIASRKAVEASRRFHPDNTRDEAVRFFRGLLGG